MKHVLLTLTLLLIFAFTVSAQMIVKDNVGDTLMIVNNDGRAVIGSTLSDEIFTVEGGIALGTTAQSVLGTIRYTGTDFEGLMDDGGTPVWTSLTAQSAYTAGTGLDLTGTEFSALNTDPMWNADQLQGSAISTTAPSTDGQVLKWDATNSEWVPGTDAGETYTAGTGLDLTANEFSALTTDPLWNANQLQGSNVTATAPSVDGQILKWDATNSQWTLGTDAGETYSAGMGITIDGTQIHADSNIAIWNADQLQGSAISSTAPSTDGQVLKWDATNSEWVPGTDASNSYTAGTGMSLAGSEFSALTTDPLWNANQLQGSDIGTTAPSTDGQVLKWDGTNNEWVPGTDAGETYTAGTGLTLAGTEFSANNSSAIWNANQLQSSAVSSTAPTTAGQVLKWDGSQWAPGTDNSTVYWSGTAGTSSTITRSGAVQVGSSSTNRMELSYDGTNDQGIIKGSQIIIQLE